MIGIYKITNTVNGKVYIGQSVNRDFRMIKHLEALKMGKHVNQKLQNDFNKDGSSSFCFEKIEPCLKKDLNKKEIFWIKQFNTTEDGYNKSSGGYTRSITAKETNINIRVEPVLTQEMDLYIKKQSNRVDSINSRSELIRRAVINFMKENYDRNL